MTKVLIVGQTPPPYSGQAIMIERFVNCKLAGVQFVHVRMGFSSHMNEVGRVRISKIVHMCAIIVRIIYHRFVDGVRILYYPPAGPDRVPMYRDIVILCSTRWLFDQTVFHFRAGGISELYDQLPTWQQWFFRRAYFGVDAAIRLSELNPEDGQRLHAKREYVIPNGLDDPFPGLILSQPEASTRCDGPIRILFVGMLRESKGVMVLIEACEKLAARGATFQVEFMGQWRSDAFADHVRKRVHELNLESRVHFLGEKLGNEKYVAYRRADIVCFPTFYNCETFGNVLIEAMACGLPVVSTNWRGIPSIVDDGETGFLVEPQNAEAVADKLELLARDAELRWHMGCAARVKFEREYIYSIHANRMQRALLETAGMAVDEAPESSRDLVVQDCSWSDAADCEFETQNDPVTV
jgi:glycosyltransferase involved in cell wall biosynthesis